MNCPETRPTGFPRTQLSAPCRKDGSVPGDGTGRVVVSPAVPHGLSRRIAAAVISEADVPAEHVEAWTETFRIVAVTRGSRGARVYANGRARDIPPVTASEVDATGAGDVWAAAFAINLAETRDVAFAANFASAAAVISIERRGMLGIPTRDEVTARMDAGPVGEDLAQRVRRTPSIGDLQGQRQLGLVHTKSTPSGGPGGHFSTPRCCPRVPQCHSERSRGI